MERPKCFTEKQWREWRKADAECHPGEKDSIPCYDCTLEYHTEMMAKSRCDLEKISKASLVQPEEIVKYMSSVETGLKGLE